MNSFADIEQLLAPLPQHFRRAYSSLFPHSIPIVNEMALHLLNHPGKQLRPLLTLTTACLCGMPTNVQPDNPLFRAAAAMEALHASTLIHDDVVDNADSRRGIATANKLWNNKIAVLLGDWFLSQVMHTVNAIGIDSVTEAVNSTVTAMCEGELLQQQKAGDTTTTIDDYLLIITKKTALFIATCCQVGAIMANATNSIADTARRFGENLGIAFQIRDDIIDFKPSSSTGKNQGNDIREHKLTLPIIFALRSSNRKEELATLLTADNLDNSQLDKAIDIVLDSGALHETTRYFDHYMSLANDNLNALPDNKFKTCLLDLMLILKEF